MDTWTEESEAAFDGYVEALVGVIGHADRAEPLKDDAASLPTPWRGKGRPTSRLRRDADHQPVSAKTLAETLAAEAWHTVAWREGTNAELSARFAAVRPRPASRDFNQEWLLIEWPEDESAPTQYWLSTLPPDTSITQPASPSLCIAACGFLISLREPIPPSAPPQSRGRQVSGLLDGPGL